MQHDQNMPSQARKGTEPDSAAGRGAEPGRTGKGALHNRDTSSKTIFGDPVLCAQFLRDHFDMPLLKNVQPEDIEDVSERYIPYLGAEFEPDSVQKIRVLDIGREKRRGSNEPPFFVSLIEHKSRVDYDVPMQLLRYMVCIWTEYRREMERGREGYTRRKGFRYPMIIPIVYYEGKAAWTAHMHLRDRIGAIGKVREWVPDFRYHLVRIHDYSNQELLQRGDEISLVMLINKIQDTADLEQFIRIPPDRMDRIIRDSPEHVIDVLVSAMESLCFKIDASAEERTLCVRKVRERKMGYLFENMKHISIQEERRKTEEQKKLTEEQKKLTEEQKKLTEEQKKLTEEQKKLTEEQKKLTEIERQKAEEQRKLTEIERQKAEEEHLRAEQERTKAEEQRLRAENAEEKLKLAEETIRQLREKYRP